MLLQRRELTIAYDRELVGQSHAITRRSAALGQGQLRPRAEPTRPRRPESVGGAGVPEKRTTCRWTRETAEIALAKLRARLDVGERVALTCFDRAPGDCHRQCVAEALGVGGAASL